jgi:hypothetical protein
VFTTHGSSKLFFHQGIVSKSLEFVERASPAQEIHNYMD